MDTVRQLILDRVPNLSATSRKIGKSHSYLQQFVKRGVPAKLPEDVRDALAVEIGVPANELRPPVTKSSQNRTVKHVPNNGAPVDTPTLNVIPGADLMGEVDLPVYSIVQGGRGALVLENEPFTFTSRPRRLVGKKGGYGVLVRGDSMAREYNENDIAYVDPNLHPKKGDPCVFQGTREDGTVEAMLKYLERSPDASETLYYVSQSNPPKKFTVKKADWNKVHVAVGKESGR